MKQWLPMMVLMFLCQIPELEFRQIRLIEYFCRLNRLTIGTQGQKMELDSAYRLFVGLSIFMADGCRSIASWALVP